MIAGRNISVSYGSKSILEAVDITIEPGRVVALCGPNGAGKSTVLAALAGDATLRTGQVAYGSDFVDELTPKMLSRARAVLEQTPSLTARFTVAELIRLSIPVEFPPAETDVLVGALLTELGLLEFQTRLVENLSGGQKHRAHLARVLAQLRANRRLFGPNTLFLDEPTASLDILHQIEVMKVAKAEARHGSGVLVVLHDLNLAAAFADRMMLMQDGRVVRSGTVGDVLQSKTLSAVYNTPIMVEKSDGAPLHIRPDFGRV